MSGPAHGDDAGNSGYFGTGVPPITIAELIAANRPCGSAASVTAC
jgi:hypothetical protein